MSYLITSGQTTAATTASSKEFQHLLTLVEAAVEAGLSLVQIREKSLTDRALYELSEKAVARTRGSATRLLLNDRADIAKASAADGVHLTTRSMSAAVIRKTFGEEFLIGVSTHSSLEVQAAQRGGADFAVFGPVFPTESKRIYGDALGTSELKAAVVAVRPLPILALGGVTLSNAAECFHAGASGVAAIRLFAEADELKSVMNSLRKSFAEAQG